MKKRTPVPAYMLLLSLSNKLILFDSHYGSPFRIKFSSFYYILKNEVFFFIRMAKIKYKVFVLLRYVVFAMIKPFNDNFFCYRFPLE